MRTEGLELRALVPVSIRAEDEHGNLGNRITLMRGPLPVYIEDPVRRRQILEESLGHIARQLELVRRRRDEIAALEGELVARRKRVRSLLRELAVA